VQPLPKQPSSSSLLGLSLLEVEELLVRVIENCCDCCECSVFDTSLKSCFRTGEAFLGRGRESTGFGCGFFGRTRCAFFGAGRAGRAEAGEALQRSCRISARIFSTSLACRGGEKL